MNLLGRDCVQDCTGCLRVASDFSEFPSVTGLGGDVGRGPNSVIISLVFAFVQFSVIVYKSGLIFPYYFISVDIILKFRIISHSTLFTPPLVLCVIRLRSYNWYQSRINDGIYFKLYAIQGRSLYATSSTV